YRLEVSSPGIDRPLTRLKDFDDWAGHEARITLVEGQGPPGRKQFSGIVIATGQGEIVQLKGKDGKDYSIPFASIASAKLLLTDKLIKATHPLSTEGADIQTVED
ncbi:MAG TPA: ribosome maturation factor, partial [Sphingomicrobium sp.]|nr:ribosome maturation factor [Sphingomicrobium sp.]